MSDDIKNNNNVTGEEVQGDNSADTPVCGEPQNGQPDTQQDAGDNVVTDEPADTQQDTGDNVVTDEPADTQQDAGDNVETDEPADTQQDTGDNVVTDEPADTQQDAGDNVEADEPADTQQNAGDNIEADVSADAQGDAAPVPKAAAVKRAKKPKKVLTPEQRRRKLIILCAVGGALLLLGIFAGVYMNRIVNSPESLFAGSKTQQPSGSTATPIPVQDPDGNAPTRTMAPTDVDNQIADLENIADYNFVNNEDFKALDGKIVNILLVGVDYADERVNNDKEYVGKNFNSDVMMILAVNFEQKKASLLSVPRDTYGYIPGSKAPYKMNFALTFGGGMTNDGFMKVCKSVQWVLGGIPVNYYVAVTMPSLKELGNIVGGVDFTVDVPFKIQGRAYEAGLQHLDGQGILDFCRARKNMEEGGDSNRVNRQKDIMLAVFRKLQRTNMLLKVPEIVMSIKENLYTNLSLEQLSALALFGKDLDPNSINLYSFSGQSALIFNFGYVLTDQNNRVKIIKEVYGVDVAKYAQYTPEYAWMKWNTQLIEYYVSLIKPKLSKDASLGTPLLTAEQTTALQALISECETRVENYKKLLDFKSYNVTDAKGNITKISTITKELYTDAGDFAELLKNTANTYFANTPYNISSWYLDVYKEDGVMKMKE